MRLIFLCGCLEPGKDGVGDYTRRLAGELVKNELQILMISLNDGFIQNSLETDQESQGSFVPALRLGKKIRLKNRFKLAKKKIDQFDPEWLSLQYVPFSFQKKGLPFGFAKQLKKLGKNRKWHLMFHELWVGMNKEASIKYKLWGAVQKTIIGNTILSLNPVLINTQSRLHQCQLEEMGFKVKLLPLFSNFKVFYKKEERKENGTLKFLVFGSIHPGAPVEKFAEELFWYGKKNNKNIHFVFLGRCRGCLDKWVNIFRNNQFAVEILGEQDPEIISEILNEVDFGVSSTPYFLFEKSGTIAAMKEQGLPVFCVAKKFTPSLNIPFFPKGIIEYKPNHLDLDPVKLMCISNTLEKTGKQFLEDLKFAELNLN